MSDEEITNSDKPVEEISHEFSEDVPAIKEAVSTEEESTKTIRKGGRPYGSKDAKKRVSPYVRAQAKALYLAGHNIDDIAAALKISDSGDISRWARV